MTKIKLFTLPNILTLANLACGCAAIVCALSWGWSRVAGSDAFFWLIAAAAVFDFLDGAAARLTRQYSEVGKQLDSLADLVSFGVAPSVALFSVYLRSEPLFEGTPAMLYEILGYGVFAVALFSALRLAKFNVDETQQEEFAGLPTPAAALTIAGLHWMTYNGSGILAHSEVILALVVVVSWLLLSPIRMFSLKFKSLGWRGNGLRYTFLASSIVLIVIFGIGGAAASVGLYVLLSAVRHVANMRRVAQK
jgi:CDP-diacylglycerol--serine O-phosphatidyltransferase